MNRVRWGIVGLAIGLVLAYLKWQTLSSPPSGRALLPSNEFERLLSGTLVDRPQMDHLMIYPTPTGYRADATAWKFANLTFIQAHVTTMFPPVFQPAGKIRPVAKDLRFLDYMRWASKKFPWIRYRYIWWDQPFWLFSDYALTAILISGGLWPLALRLTMGGSTFEKVGMKTKNYKLPGLNPNTTSPNGPPTDGDVSLLAAAIEVMKAGLGDPGGQTHSEPVSKGLVIAPKSLLPKQPPHESPVKRVPDDAKKQFGGDFYPTELHGNDLAGS